jgi:hypothetical protein
MKFQRSSEGAHLSANAYLRPVFRPNSVLMMTKYLLFMVYGRKDLFQSKDG